MIIDLAQHRPSDSHLSHYDVCVVGAGAAGIVLATALVERGLRVALLEAGGADHEASAFDAVRGEVVGRDYPGLTRGRFRVLGGTTLEWGGQILELDDIDFVERSWVSGSGWPFSKVELQPYYDQVLAFVGLDRTFKRADELWGRLGVSPPPYGREVEPKISNWCPERNFAVVAASTLHRNPNLQVFLHATARAFRLADNGSSVVNVECRAPDGRAISLAATNYVLCLGGIETSRFLLQPSEGGQLPWQSRGLVGRHFGDHIVCTLGSIPVPSRNDLQALLDYSSVDGLRYHPKLALAPGTQERHRCLNAAATVTAVPNTAGRQDCAHAAFAAMRQRRWSQLRVRDAAALAAEGARRFTGKFTGREAAREPQWQTGPLTIRGHIEQLPLGASRIMLSDQQDRSGMRRVQLDWQISPAEYDTISVLAHAAKYSVEAAGMGEVNLAPGIDDRSVDTIADSNHHMGGTRMSALPNNGVVDPDLKLWGVDNGYVCSASVFPSFGFSNPTHTVLALAIRLADHLSARSPKRSHIHRAEAAADAHR